MSLLKRLVKGVVSITKDATSIAIAPIASSVNSISNKETIKLSYDTKVGGVVGGSVTVGTDSLHKGLIGFADAVSGGYATKATDLIRSDDAKVSKVGRIQDRKQDFGVDSKFLNEYESLSKKGGGIIGTIGGAVVGSSKSNAAGKAAGTAGTELKAVEAVASKGAEASTVARSAEKIVSAENIASKIPSSAGGVVGATLKTNQDMSLFNSISTAFNTVDKAAQTPTGQAATSMLGSVVYNLTRPKPAPQNTAAQQAAFSTPTPANLTETMLNSAAAAAFGNTGQAKFMTVSNNSGSGTGSPGFWTNNKTWLMPVLIVLGAVSGIVTLYKVLFSKSKR